MNLRELAHADLMEIVQAPDSGTCAISITSPTGVIRTFKAWTSDIHFSIDPGTGAAVEGRQVSILVLISDLISVGFEGIGATPEGTGAWQVDVFDINNRPFVFCVASALPDNSAGLMVLFLEDFKRLGD